MDIEMHYLVDGQKATNTRSFAENDTYKIDLLGKGYCINLLCNDGQISITETINAADPVPNEPPLGDLRQSVALIHPTNGNSVLLKIIPS